MEHSQGISMASMTHPDRFTEPVMIFILTGGSPNFFTVKFIADVLISLGDLDSTRLSIALRLESPVMHDLSLFVQELSVYAI